MRKLAATIADALEAQGLSREAALEVAQNGLSLCTEALMTAAARQGHTVCGHRALCHVAHELMGDEERARWERAEEAMERGDPGPMYGLLHARSEESKRRMAAGGSQ